MGVRDDVMLVSEGGPGTFSFVISGEPLIAAPLWSLTPLYAFPFDFEPWASSGGDPRKGEG